MRKEEDLTMHIWYCREESGMICLVRKMTAHQSTRSEWYSPLLCQNLNVLSDKEIQQTYEAQTTSGWNNKWNSVCSANI